MPQSLSVPAPRTFVSVQVLRAIAAMMVVGLHAALQCQQFGAFPNGWALGNAGVDIFFPISGFVMVVSTHDRGVGAGEAGRFALARVIRIAPIYYLLTLLKSATMLGSGLSAAPLTAKTFLAALLFTPLHTGLMLVPPPIKPGWTLNLEMFYYALIVAVLLFSRRIWVYVPALLIALVAVVALLPMSVPGFSGEGGWASPLALEFAAGMIIGEITLRTSLVGRWKWVALALGFGLYLIRPQDEWMRVLAWGVPGMLFLWAAVGFESRLPKTVIVSGLALLGDASYSIYLTHALTQPVLTRAMKQLGLQPWPAAVFVLLIVVAGLGGVVFHLTVEKPLTRWLKQALGPAARRARQPVAPSAP